MPEKFEILYKAHYTILRNAVENIINDKDAAHDVVQEVFLKIFAKKDELHLIQNIKAYLFKSAINSSITYLENNKPKKQLGELTLLSDEDADSNLLAKELEEKIRQSLNKLPPKCKAIFILSRFENMKYKEIAECLTISEKTVENQMGIAIKRMRSELEAYVSSNHRYF